MDESNDIRKGTEHVISWDSIEDLLASVKYVNFYEAMSTNYYKPSKLSIEDYSIVLIEFKKRMHIKDSSIEKQLHGLMIDITVLSNCLVYLPVLGFSSDDAIMLTRYGVDISNDLRITIDNIQLRLNKLIAKYELLNGELPVLKNVIKTTGQDIIAELSLSIELPLSMDLNLLEYISYHRAAKKKNESIKNATKK